MGKLLQATRRMVNETFGRNLGRVRDVKKAREMAREENAEHTRQQKQMRLARLALEGPRIAELKDGSGLPETKVGSPEFVAKMFTNASEYMSGRDKGDESTGRWLPAMYDLPSLGQNVKVEQVSCYGDFIATKQEDGGQIIGMVETRDVGGTDSDPRRVRVSTSYDPRTGVIKEVRLTNHLQREKRGREYTGDHVVTKTDGEIWWFSPDGTAEHVATDENGVRKPGTLYRENVEELAHLQRLKHMMEHFDRKLEKSGKS